MRHRRPATAALVASVAVACSAAAGEAPGAAPDPSAPVLEARTALSAPVVEGGQPASSGQEVTVWQTGRRATDGAAVVAAALAHSAPSFHAGEVPVVEGIDRPGPGAAVVTILTFAEGQVTRRLAVAVMISQGRAVATGDLWTLPLPSRGQQPLLAEFLHDPRLDELAVRALEEAGLGHLEFVRLARALDSWPIVAEVTAPEGPRLIWLRRDGDHLTVAGLPRTALQAEPTQ